MYHFDILEWRGELLCTLYVGRPAERVSPMIAALAYHFAELKMAEMNRPMAFSIFDISYVSFLFKLRQAASTIST